jgi:GTP-binding protein
MFVDEVDIHVTAGAGGRGCVAFRREKRVPRGGPSGGDGGHGGSIYAVASPHVNTLIGYRFHPEFKAQRGGHGQGSNRTGHNGEDLVLAVPIGTLVYERPSASDPDRRLIADLSTAGERVLVAKGGRGGLGNAQFATATNRAPRKVQPGEPGDEKFLRLELKLLADVGLVGFPNAGKSTLIARISAARPKIADYPFTTLTPNLGVVSLSGDRSFVVADVPGLIEGAHRGLGLGHRFLRHLERTAVLVHVVDVSSASRREPVQDLEIVRRELELFQPALAAKPQLVAANKMDALDDESRVRALSRRAAELGLPFFRISGVTGEGVPALLEGIWPPVAAARALNPPSPTLLDAAEGPLTSEVHSSDVPGFSGSGGAQQLAERDEHQTRPLRRPARRVRTGSGHS